MRMKDCVRVAAAAGCGVATVLDFVSGKRKSRRATVAAIESAMRELDLWDDFAEQRALERAEFTPMAPHEVG